MNWIWKFHDEIIHISFKIDRILYFFLVQCPLNHAWNKQESSYARLPGVVQLTFYQLTCLLLKSFLFRNTSNAWCKAWKAKVMQCTMKKLSWFLNGTENFTKELSWIISNDPRRKIFWLIKHFSYLDQLVITLWTILTHAPRSTLIIITGVEK